jgi:hypothetical protein
MVAALIMVAALMQVLVHTMRVVLGVIMSVDFLTPMTAGRTPLKIGDTISALSIGLWTASLLLGVA